MKNLNSVKVLFDNPKYNYITSVSRLSTEKSLTDYFVGTQLNLGHLQDNLQVCTGIEFTDNNQYKFIGTCDRLRQTHQGEQNWQSMMNDKQRISFEDFIKYADDSFLDDEEIIVDWISEQLEQDSNAAPYYSFWGNQPCIFFQTCGFEFIFECTYKI